MRRLSARHRWLAWRLRGRKGKSHAIDWLSLLTGARGVSKPVSVLLSPIRKRHATCCIVEQGTTHLLPYVTAHVCRVPGVHDECRMRNGTLLARCMATMSGRDVSCRCVVSSNSGCNVMNSLRAMVERWLAHMPPSRVSFARFKCDSSGRRCHVRVHVHRPEGDVAIHFFRHCDGMWRVFPPASAPIVMGYPRMSRSRPRT